MSLRERNKDKRRRAILAAAAALMRERGIDGFTMKDVAERAEVAPATVYNLVGGLNAVAAAILDDAVDAIALDPEPEGGSADDPIERLLRHVDAVFEVFERRRDDVRPALLVYLTRRGSADWAAERPMAALMDRALATYGGLVRAAQDAGLFDRAIPADAVAGTLFAALKTRIDGWVLGLGPARDPRALARCDAALILLSGTSGEVRARLTAILARS